MKIICFSDFNLIGSGYMNISAALCSSLVERGHEVKVVGISYAGEEHDFGFSIIPCANFQEAAVIIHNLVHLWNPDVLVASGDIPWHEQLMSKLSEVVRTRIPYVGIFPVESPPLCLDWGMVLMMMHSRLCISDFGTKECLKLDVPALHLPVGIDTTSWRPPSEKERKELRSSLGYEENDFVILTVADNQERKNLGREMQIISAVRKLVSKNIIFTLVTREKNSAGFKLRSLANREDINIGDCLRIYERGMSFRDLWAMYASADLFLLTSRSEGLGMPIVEAMATNLPAVATDCCAISTHLADGRGYLLPVEFVYPDVFGNGDRYMVGIDTSAKIIADVIEHGNKPKLIDKARKYAEDLKWNKAVDVLEKELERLKNEQTKSS